ncbi:MAG: sigma-54-dependent Fis family transcriptional regulator [Planctomycetaceae bacterium]|nr:sigma-54-dependent Fis family transcriptional regulator [Planctomycetaceae bacterium]
MSRILIVDDEPAICWALQESLTDLGHDVQTCSSAESGLQKLETFTADVILLDHRLPGMSGAEAFAQFQSKSDLTPIVLMTAFGSLNLAVDIMRQGAFDYLPKPFDLDEVADIISRALSKSSQPVVQKPAEFTTEEMIGVSRSMQEVFRQIALVAPLNIPVLITGESGVGKELIARAIHQHSQRSAGRFVPVCVPALNESLLESELFGHVKGAFTGAEKARPGLLDLADGGTAFFDEIGDVPLPQQVKLLRVLEDGNIIPVGGTESHRSDFRLVAATNRDLEAFVKQERFREDLYFRLNVFRIHVPALRERPEDILPLARHFMSEVSPTDTIQLPDETVSVLQQRHWPGNARELRSVIQHAVVVSRGGAVTPDCLPPERRQPIESTGLTAAIESWVQERLPAAGEATQSRNLWEQFLEEFEPVLLNAVLKSCHGNQSSAAEILGIHRETLRKRLKRHTDSFPTG